jgi:HPt (histidine-containing phosphotransfer) domain-containing protein
VEALDPQILDRVAEPTPRDAATAVFDSGAVERLLATLDDDGPSRVANLIAAFLEESPRLLTALRTALDHREPEAVRQAAHSLKRSAAGLGAIALSSRCREVETAAKAGNLKSAYDLAAELEAEYGRAHDALEALAETLERGATRR